MRESLKTSNSNSVVMLESVLSQLLPLGQQESLIVNRFAVFVAHLKDVVDELGFSCRKL